MKEQVFTLKNVLKVIGALPITSALVAQLDSSPVLVSLLCLALICWFANKLVATFFGHKSRVAEVEPDRLRAQAELLLAQAKADKIARSG